MGWLGEAGARLQARRSSSEITVAVTGLSRSGKTAFITSAVANLIAAQVAKSGQTNLPGFDLVEQGRLQAANVPANFVARDAKHGKRLVTAAAG